MKQYVAFCTKGLEKIVEEEIEEKLSDATIESVADKRILFLSNLSFFHFERFKTVDDLGIVLFSEKSILAETVVEKIVECNLLEIRELLGKYRKIDSKSFSITTSIIGKGDIDILQMVEHLAEVIENKFEWIYTPKDHTQFDIRIFMDHNDTIVSIRVSSESLHHRAYKQQSVLGALRPTVAAVMVHLATEERSGLKLVDNFCGSGTILCEAAEIGADVYGGDIESERVSIALTNLHKVGFIKIDQLKHLNAFKTPWKNEYFDCAVSNLPWDKQVEVKSLTELYIGALQEYKRIVKPDGMICLLVSKPELLIKHAKRFFPDAEITSYKLGLLGQTPTIVRLRLF